MPENWWLEAGRRYPATTAPLSYTGGPPKGLLHTTEGTTIAGAVAAYRANASWPHITMSFEGGRFRAEQHLPVDQAARALRNEAGGPQTNRDHVVQAEIVAYAADPRPWVGEFLAGIRRWMRWVEANAGVERRCDVEFKAYPDSYGRWNGVRLSPVAWDAYGGWCGHQHVPENTHGDPGAIPIAYLLAVPPAPPLPPPAPTESLEDDVTGYPMRIELGADGTGWAYVEVPKGRIVNTEVNGMNIEGRSDTGRAIVADSLAWGPGARIVLRASEPGPGAIDVTVWTTG